MVHYHYWRWDRALSEDVCDFIMSQLDWGSAEEGTVGTQKGDLSLEEIRRSEVIWQDSLSAIGCISTAYIHAANRFSGWNFELSYLEPVQLTKYDSARQGHYDWHRDSAAPNADQELRKLSFVALLSDSSEFEGGEFEINEASLDKNILNNRGDVVVFPSYLNHRVSPVTSGVRHSAVAWMIGPQFK